MPHWGVWNLFRGGVMLRTIEIGSTLLIQGILVRALANGKLVVRVDDKLYAGYPVPSSHDVKRLN